MNERISKEFELLMSAYPSSEFREDSQWVLIRGYRLPLGMWNKDVVDVCFQITAGYPGNPPYSFHVCGGIRIRGTDIKPDGYEEPSQTPFPGVWGRFSWQQDNSWRATADVNSGGNILNFVRSLADRFKEGK